MEEDICVFFYLPSPPTVDYENTMCAKRYDVVPKNANYVTVIFV